MHAIMTSNNDLPELRLSRWHGANNVFSNARIGFGEHPGGGGYDLTLSTANGELGVVNEQMRITYSGNIGIGTPSPLGQLHLRGGSGSQMNAIITTNNDLPELMLSRWHGANNAFSNARIGFGEHPGGGGYDLMLSTANGELGAVNEQMRITYSGNVGIGTTSPTSKLEVVGTTTTKVLKITGGMDLAEPFEISENQPIPKGALVIIDEENPGQLKSSHQAYDKRVADAISGAGGINPGITLTQEGVLLDGGQNVASAVESMLSPQQPMAPLRRLIYSRLRALRGIR
ncbi:hypothetical protein L6R21_10770 [bacterium]|nr:hypothetical protein [bacterium]